jgi:formyl-CoA transferase/succinate--hydroxymethylglutarate CoA-transferase
VRGISEALESPEVAEAGMVTTVDHPTAGELRMMASPLKLSGTPTATPVAPPLLGQHTDEVLTELLNLDAAALAALRESNVIG